MTLPVVVKHFAATRSIIPVSMSKSSLVKWRELQKRRMTLEELTKYEDAPAWAHVTGEISGVFTIDIDISGKAWGDKNGLTKLAHRMTPSEGFHIDVQLPEGFVVKNTQSELHLGVDTRGEGGIALIAGRTHKGRYAWLKPASEWDAIPFQSLPKFLQDDLEEIARKMERVVTVDFTPRPVTRDDLEDYLLRARSRAPMEGRNAMGFWLACRLRDAGADKEVARDIGYEYVNTVWMTNTHGVYEPYTTRMFDAALENAYMKASS